MIVLAIIAAIVALVLLAWFINYSNHYSLKKYGCEIFNVEEFGAYVIAYAFLYFGYDWFEKALSHNGDTLNGIILMVIGSIILIALVLSSIEETSIRYGLAMGLVKIVLYAAAAPVVIAGLFLIGAWLMETKPVVRLDD